MNPFYGFFSGLNCFLKSDHLFLSHAHIKKKEKLVHLFYSFIVVLMIWRTFVGKKMKYVDLSSENQTCLECGDMITYGRSDKLYCSEACRNRHNNRIHNARKAARARVLSQLDKNYRILERLLDSGATSVDLGELMDMGYNINYSTSYRKIRGRNEYCCYDIRFFCTPNRIMKLERVMPGIRLKP